MIALTKSGFREISWKEVATGAVEYIALYNSLEDAHEKLAKKAQEDERIKNAYGRWHVDGNTLTFDGIKYECDIYKGTNKELYKLACDLGISRCSMINQRKSNSMKIFVHDGALIAMKFSGSFYFYDKKWERVQ